MFCVHCGSSIKGTGPYCPVCGRQIGQQPSRLRQDSDGQSPFSLYEKPGEIPPEEARRIREGSKRQLKKWIIGVLIVFGILVVVLIVTALMWLARYGSF